MNLTPLLRSLFWPASLFYQGYVRLRAWAYRRGILKQRRLNGVVISVGNLTVGGTGKTPMVLWLSERLLAEGRRIGILTRGYRGARGSTEQGGSLSDEVALLRGRLRENALFGVGANRYAQGERLERQGANWFVLDDGFQHLRLARDVDIVLIDATNPFGHGYLLPAGRLREPKSALARADIVVVTRSEHAPAVEAAVRFHTSAPIFHALTELEDVPSAVESTSVQVPLSWRGARFFAFCGIGNPAAFYEDLRRWEIKVVGTADYRDHHRFSQSDADDLERRAEAAGATALLCTEKDVWNFNSVQFRPIPVCFCRTNLRVLEAEEFWQAVKETARRKRAGAGR